MSSAKDSKRNIEKFVGKKYKVEKVLGEGGFCIVLKARDINSQKLVAIKRTDRTKPVYKKFKGPEGVEKINELMRKEAECMRALKHPNLMQLLDYMEINKTIYLVLEFAEGGELFAKVVKRGKFSEKDTKHVIKQVIAGIKFMHDRGYVHRDIKAENVLFSDKTQGARVLLTDFGLSRQCKTKMYTNCGTIVYSAPELLLNKTTKDGYDNKVDVWAIGVLMFFVLSGKLPFGNPTSNENDIKMYILSGKYSMKKGPWLMVSKAAKELIDKFLVQNPLNRISLEDAEEHFWISGIYRPKIEHLDLYPTMEKKMLTTLAIVRWKVLLYMALFFNQLCKEFTFIKKIEIK